MRPGTHPGRWKIATPVALAITCAVVAGFAQRGAQVTTPPVVPSSSTSGNRPGYSDPNVFNSASGMDMFHGDDPSIRMARQNARRDEMKKHMEQNATRLLLLSAELRADLQTREPTEADGKRLEEIARLAHAVREQMKQ